MCLSLVAARARRRKVLSSTLKRLGARFSLEKERDPNRSAIEHFKVPFWRLGFGSIRVSKSDIYQVSLLTAGPLFFAMAPTSLPPFTRGCFHVTSAAVPFRVLWSMSLAEQARPSWRTASASVGTATAGGRRRRTRHLAGKHPRPVRPRQEHPSLLTPLVIRGIEWKMAKGSAAKEMAPRIPQRSRT